MQVWRAFSRFFILSFFLFLFVRCNESQGQERGTNKDEPYQCLPCGYDCDTFTHDKPGICSHCQMPLVKKSTVTHNTIDPSTVCRYIKEHPDVILLDVRTKDEFDGKAVPNFGTLKNAINIPVQDLEKQLPNIAALKNKKIIVFCSHSHRSPRASYILTTNGFKDVTNMAGGMSKMNDDDCKK